MARRADTATRMHMPQDDIRDHHREGPVTRAAKRARGALPTRLPDEHAEPLEDKDKRQCQVDAPQEWVRRARTPRSKAIRL